METPSTTPFHFKLNDGEKQLALASCLPGQWLNDNVINFFVAALQHSLQKKGEQRFMLFETYFWSMLRHAHGDVDELDRLVKWRNCNAQRWKAEYWLIPMLVRGHWFLAVLQLPKDLRTSSELYLYIFDSLYTQRLNKTYAPLRNFIACSWMKQYPDESPPTGVNLVIRQLRVPTQTNDSDCGVFLLVYLRKFTEQPITTHAPHWFPTNHINQLRDMLYTALEKKSGQDPPSSSSSHS